MKEEGISVIMPTYKQASFIERAIKSLLLQTFTKWELIIINDGSDDNTEEVIKPYLSDRRISYFSNPENIGLGACLNRGIERAKYDLISYLPSDDLFFKEHLASLYDSIISNKNVILAYSGIKYGLCKFTGKGYGYVSEGIVEGNTLQLVQVLHLRTSEKWLERNELVTDDLNLMFWNKLLKNKLSVNNKNITCEWVDHPNQRHKIINEFHGGGIYLYKRFYNVNEPLYFKSSLGNLEDEVGYFKDFRKQYDFDDKKGLRILIVGDLSYNSERICAFEERGNKLYGFWTKELSNHTTVGPLPFGNIENINPENWEEQIGIIKPDIIYALSNYHSISTAHKVLMKFKNIPFVWHLKEGPFDARAGGIWDKLIDLYRFSNGRVFYNNIIKEWYSQFLHFDPETCFFMDGELPKKEWFSNNKSPLLSHKDGEFHTVCAGRPVGLSLENILEITSQNIHMHFYGDIFHRAYWDDLLDAAIKSTPKYIHLHPNCSPKDWAKEFSQYDAGWLHYFESENKGEFMRANWLDLNSPARISTYAMAGLPMIQFDNSKHLVSAHKLAKDLDIGIFLKSFLELKKIFSNKKRMQELRDNMWKHRFNFCYDDHVDGLISFFKKVINNPRS